MRSVLFQIGPITVYGYGLMIAVGILAAFWIAINRARAKGLSEDAMFSMGIIGIIGGLIGAKLLYYIVELPAVLRDPFILLRVNEGFVVYGGLIGGFASPILYARVKKLPFWKYLDQAVAGVAAAQGFGRIGCFLAGCCYGKETDSLFGVVFPEGCLAPAGIKVIPTQLLSSVGDFLLAAILLFAGRKERRQGVLSGMYLMLYSAGRFAIEFLRNDPRGSIGVLSTSQFIAIFMFAAGLVVTVLSERKALPDKIAG